MDYDALVKLAADVQYRKTGLTSIVKSGKLQKLGIDVKHSHSHKGLDDFRKRVVRELRKRIENMEQPPPPEIKLSGVAHLPHSAYIHPNVEQIYYENIDTKNAPMNNENSLRKSRSNRHFKESIVINSPRYAMLGLMPTPPKNNNDDYVYSSPKVTGYYPRGGIDHVNEMMNMEGGRRTRRQRRTRRRRS